ncbi:MAG: hypothetical protein V5A27_00620, partial [Halapricum sp.]
PTVRERDEALATIHTEHVAPDDETAASENERSTQEGSVEMEDEQLLSKARNAKNGEKFARLWRGNTSGYESQSEADMALCSLLAFWTGGDHDRIDRLFRESGLMREKWDEVHFSDGSTYGEKTVERAVAGTSEVYDPGSGVEEEAIEPEGSSTDPSRTGSGSAGRSVERMESLHGTIENLNRRIQTLESENTRLKTELDEERARRKALESRLDSSGSDSDSWWIRVWSTVTSR